MIFSLNIEVLDYNGNDITALGEAGAVQLYIFDEKFYYLDQISIAAEDIINKKKFDFTYINHRSIYVVAWSNLNGNQTVSPPVFSNSTSIENALIQLKRDVNGYAMNPDDMFAGVMQVSGSENNDKTMTIERKTALMSLTATGVPSNQPNENYHFVIKGARQDAYNFRLNFTGNPILYREYASYATQQNTTKAASSTIHTPAFKIFPLSSGERFTIEIYNGANLLGVADRDDQGRDIVPVRGQTINILLDFSEGSPGFRVTVVATDWNDLYQWVVW